MTSRQTSGLSKYQLVGLAVALLGGDQDYVDTEDVAVRVSEIVPGRFAWRKHPDHIDLESVRVALRDAKKPKNNQIVIGSSGDGWMLSPLGTRWIESLVVADAAVQGALQARKESIAASRDLERVRLRRSNASALCSAGHSDQMTIDDLYQFARINQYFKGKSRQRRLTLVGGATYDDEALECVWETLRSKFEKEFVTDASC
jgi:hypothetical protein